MVLQKNYTFNVEKILELVLPEKKSQTQIQTKRIIA